jgi:hypothetical protein
MIQEPNKNIKVAYECDVVVVGGGPGGIGAAVSAARNGAKTVLIERYGHLGGMGTGGLVTIIPCLSISTGMHRLQALPRNGSTGWTKGRRAAIRARKSGVQMTITLWTIGTIGLSFLSGKTGLSTPRLLTRKSQNVF